jgi:hypothetical protein
MDVTDAQIVVGGEMEAQKPYLRWHPAKPQGTGAFRGHDEDMFVALNDRVMEAIRKEAFRENAERRLLEASLLVEKSGRQ